jgi:hypothetical protein
MKLITTLTFALASLCVLATDLSAQNGPVPSITSVPDRRAYNSGNLPIYGTNLSLASSVRINGVPTPILRVLANRIVVGPVPTQDPGIGSVELVYNRGVESAPIKFLPTLEAIQRGVRLTLKLSNGDTGTYVVRFSYITPGSGAIDPGIYGPRYLGPFSSILVSGFFPTASTLTLTGLTIPISIDQIGSPLQLQAVCFSPAQNVTAYTNLATVPGYTFPQGP